MTLFSVLAEITGNVSAIGKGLVFGLGAIGACRMCLVEIIGNRDLTAVFSLNSGADLPQRDELGHRNSPIRDQDFFAAANQL